MTDESNSQWHDLTTLWKRESAEMSIHDLHRYARRARSRLLLAAISQLLACAIGIANAAWLILFTPMRYLGWGMGVGLAIFALVALRWYWGADRVIGADNAIEGLDADRRREERVLDILATGRVVVLAALAAVVIAASTQLRQFHGDGLSGLLPFAASGLYLIVVSIVGALLSRKARQRAAVFLHVREELKGHKGSDTSDMLARSEPK